MSTHGRHVSIDQGQMFDVPFDHRPERNEFLGQARRGHSNYLGELYRACEFFVLTTTAAAEADISLAVMKLRGPLRSFDTAPLN
jgi:hypothetical protein